MRTKLREAIDDLLDVLDEKLVIRRENPAEQDLVADALRSGVVIQEVERAVRFARERGI